MSGDVKVRVSLRDGTIELEGPQEFVERQMESFSDVIKASLEGHRPLVGRPGKPAPDPGGGDDQQQDPAGGATGGPYANVHAIDGDKVQLIVEALPGDSDNKKTINAALLMLLGYESIGKTELGSEVIAEVCKHYGCYSEGNFAKALRKENRLFLIGGTSRKQTVKLTMPGRVKAKEMAETLNREGSKPPEQEPAAE